MREQRNYASRTNAFASPEIPLEPRKKYFLFYEGTETERIYFDAVNQNRKAMKISPLIELVPLLRSYSEQGCSNPKKIVEIILRNLEEQKSRRFSYRTLLDRIMDYYEKHPLPNVYTRFIWNTLTAFCEETLQVNLDDSVEAPETICEQLLTAIPLPDAIDYILETANSDRITYEKGLDKICIIADRDPQSFSETQFDFVLQQCAEHGFGFYLTNPCFEFWLLMHFDAVKHLDREKLLTNPKVTKKRRYTEQELRSVFPRYEKSSYDTNTLIARIDTAIANEKQFCEETELLKTEIGSNVGLLIEEMRSA